MSEEKSQLIEIEEEKILEESGEIGDMPPIPSQEYKMLTDEVESMSLAEEVQDHEELFSEEEDWQLNDHRLLELPKTLHFAKHLLDQGEIESAYEILQAFIKNKDHLGEIKTWISDMISVEETSNSTPWEILGDIALMQDEPSEALSSYKRALSILLNDKQGA